MRLDRFLVERGFAETRSRAQDLIRRGAVRVGGQIAEKTGLEITGSEPVQVSESTHYASRGALKLIAALDAFGFAAAGLTCLDAGASTGGFTQVLIERGAKRVYAVDVGRGQLHPKIAGDSRVVSLEGTDIRALLPQQLAGPIEALTCDLSFISLSKALPALLKIPSGDAWLVALVKPQFEVGRALVGKGGVVRDEEAKRKAVDEVAALIENFGWKIAGRLPSPITGSDGNEEFLLGAVRL